MIPTPARVLCRRPRARRAGLLPPRAA